MAKFYRMGKGEKEAINMRMEEISMRNRGVLEAGAVVEDAKDPMSPLHNRFDWDNSIAGDKWRLHQARQLIAYFETPVKIETKILKCPTWVRDPMRLPHEQGYVQTVKIKGKEEIAIETVRYYFERAEKCMERALDLSDILGLGMETRRLLKRITDMRGKIG